MEIRTDYLNKKQAYFVYLFYFLYGMKDKLSVIISS